MAIIATIAAAATVIIAVGFSLWMLTQVFKGK